MRLKSRIRAVMDDEGINPHALSMDTGITYRIVLALYKSEEIPLTTSVGTLALIARSLGKRMDDLVEVQQG